MFHWFKKKFTLFWGLLEFEEDDGTGGSDALPATILLLLLLVLFRLKREFSLFSFSSSALRCFSISWARIALISFCTVYLSCCRASAYLVKKNTNVKNKYIYYFKVRLRSLRGIKSIKVTKNFPLYNITTCPLKNGLCGYGLFWGKLWLRSLTLQLCIKWILQMYLLSHLIERFIWRIRWRGRTRHLTLASRCHCCRYGRSCRRRRRRRRIFHSWPWIRRTHLKKLSFWQILLNLFPIKVSFILNLNNWKILKFLVKK